MPPGPCGSMELVATSNTPQPQAQARTLAGVKTTVDAKHMPSARTGWMEFRFWFLWMCFIWLVGCYYIGFHQSRPGGKKVWASGSNCAWPSTKE